MKNIKIFRYVNTLVDHLCFVKGCEGWKIVAKIWHPESTAAIATME